MTVFTICFLALCLVIAVYNKDELVATFKPGSSPIDWCESNYKYTDNIAEFWNSLTSLCFLVPSISGYFIFKGSKMEKHEPNVYLLWISNLTIGLGSVYFHGSLSIAGQILDELPIIIMNVFGMFMMFPLHKWRFLNILWLRNYLFTW